MLLQSAEAQNKYSGYYKDLFMDSGISLNTYPDLPAAQYLGLSMERFCTAKENGIWGNETDNVMQKNVFSGSPIDENGVLLYPDGAPRFRAIYINGGQSTRHGKTLGESGRNNLRAFYNNGGSFVGTCAGSIIPSKGRHLKDGYKDFEEYLGIWPGYITGTGLNVSATSLSVEKKCPLLKYYDFGGDYQIDSVRHNGGCYMDVASMPKGTEILLRYVADTIKLKKSIHQEVNAWAYKASDKAGRIVVTGSHPERMVSGDRLQMFAGMIRYALDGNGAPQVKAVLKNGEPREMTCSTHDNNPEFAKIGDRQYHHFVIDIPKKTKEVTVNLKGIDGFTNFHLLLFAAQGKFAFNTDAEYFSVLEGVEKSLTIQNPKPGKLYVSVFCETTVETIDTPYGEQYAGRLEVLNGVPYIIEVKY